LKNDSISKKLSSKVWTVLISYTCTIIF